MKDSVVISDRFRAPVIASRQDSGGVVLRIPSRNTLVILSAAEVRRFVSFANDLGVLQKHPVLAPESTDTHESGHDA